MNREDHKFKWVIAIDGPAGSGKSTVTHLLAKRLQYTHIDTGALYRALALKAERQQITHPEALGQMALQTQLEFRWIQLDPPANRLFMDGKDVSNEIRTPEISQLASKISAFPQVRDALLDLQRRLGESGGVVLEGRDIGTVVFPNADIKFYLTASEEKRAERRRIELEGKGIYLSLDEVLKQVRDRDRADMERPVAPLRKAKDAIEIDSTLLTIEEVVEKMLSAVKNLEKS